MCNFVPGQAVAIGPIDALRDIGTELPGRLGPVVPLVSPMDRPHGESALSQMGSVVLQTEPGLEVYAVSRLSARLSQALAKGDAAVDLNHLLPMSSPVASDAGSLRLSKAGDREAEGLQRLLRWALPPAPAPLRVAVLDSGLAHDFLPYREANYLDYTAGGRYTPDRSQSDPHGHGTRVVSILDRILPETVALSVGRLPADNNALTALTIAQALGDIVVRESPTVVNLSVSSRNDFAYCPTCRALVPTPTFFSGLLPVVIRMAGRNPVKTHVVMAAGNSGQIANARWLTDDIDTLLLAYAENSHRERTRYSCATTGPRADLFSVGAFGGDDPGGAEAQGVFADGSHGTSFAAPFVTAAALLAIERRGPVAPPGGIGAEIQDYVWRARQQVNAWTAERQP